MRELEQQIEELFTLPATELTGAVRESAVSAFAEFKAALNAGRVRAASRNTDGKWEVHGWVKRGILLGFRLGAVVDYSIDGNFRFFDKETYPTKRLTALDGVRVVPGGSSVRDGAYLGTGVTIMPPAYINVGAYVDDSTMIDSHALVGSCAQVGKRCHISAAAQIGGVLEPVGALPVVIEDDVLVGGNCGVYEGAIVRARAILASGVILTGSTPVYDAVRGRIYRRSDDAPLEVPEGAVVVPGARQVTVGPAKDWGLSVYTPVIVKYRDEKTDASVRLEEFLR
ncbi:MAG: 2,3,4,5-tetrahydropyridine-2,6-dicarboxylate N-succinyltransferase [Acidobacteria bacterium]|nr:2,3,4,5-tetrahydropyridine-2,6-dicarboxylate N-succinyltransferase [Acidobacteriota bacterium]MCW5970467.1 2,3,4,5-tetrahydropyridine-2,6-dicarboxylate N-succinyltransferase [Blastocatellales bacterium]